MSTCEMKGGDWGVESMGEAERGKREEGGREKEGERVEEREDGGAKLILQTEME